MLTEKELIEQYKELRKSKKDYGNTSVIYLEDVKDFAKSVQAKSVLDYGCGTSTLADSLGMKEVHKYDPAVEQYSHRPETGHVDLITCTDVFEHLLQESVERALGYFTYLAPKGVYLVIHLADAINTLPNGMNAHINIKLPEEWIALIRTWMAGYKVGYTVTNKGRRLVVKCVRRVSER